MKDYQPIKNNPFVLPDTLYKFVLEAIRCDFDLNNGSNDGIREAVEALPEEHRRSILNNVLHRTPLKPRNKETSLLKAKFIHDVAHHNHWI